MLDITEIELGVWQGADPYNELPTTIQSVLNLRNENPPQKYHDNLVSVLWMPTIDGIFKGFSWLDTCVNYVIECRQLKQATLVHCAAGISRSTLVVAAYLIKARHMSAIQALDTIGEKRPCIGPLPAYKQALKEYHAFHKLIF